MAHDSERQGPGRELPGGHDLTPQAPDILGQLEFQRAPLRVSARVQVDADPQRRRCSEGGGRAVPGGRGALCLRGPPHRARRPL